jgi:DHA2 family multidrug resistance protein
MIPINVLALGTLPPERIKNASGLFNLTRNLGGAFGLAAINTILQSRTDLHAARLADHVAWGSSVAEEKLAGMVASLQPVLASDAEMGALERLRGMVMQQATVMAFADVFLIIAVLFGAMILMVSLVEKPKAAGGGAGGH